MLQMSKIVQSRCEWREKAVQRAEESREDRKTIKRHKEKICDLKEKIERLEEQLKEQTLLEKKTNY